MSFLNLDFGQFQFSPSETKMSETEYTENTQNEENVPNAANVTNVEITANTNNEANFEIGTTAVDDDSNTANVNSSGQVRTLIPETSFESNASAFSHKSIRLIGDTKRKARPTLGKRATMHRYTINGRLIRAPMLNERIYQPTYRCEPRIPLDMEHIRFIIKVCVTNHVMAANMDSYQSSSAMQFCDDLAYEIRIRIKVLRFDRFRLIVLVNLLEKQQQGACWKMAFLWDKKFDQWTSYQYETKTYILNVVVLNVYWD